LIEIGGFRPEQIDIFDNPENVLPFITIENRVIAEFDFSSSDMNGVNLLDTITACYPSIKGAILTGDPIVTLQYIEFSGRYPVFEKGSKMTIQNLLTWLG